MITARSGVLLGVTCTSPTTSHVPQTAVVLLTGATSALPCLGGDFVLALSHLFDGSANLPLFLVAITCGANAEGPRDGLHTLPGVAQSGTWGFARVLRLEQPALSIISQDASHRAPGHGAFAALQGTRANASAGMAEPESITSAHHCYVARLRHVCDVPATQVAGLALRGAYVITGGLGGLGLRACALFRAHGACVILSSRGGRASSSTASA